MNRNYLIGFAVAAALLGTLAFAGWSLFEIHPKTRYVPPSREARINSYLALDRWLTGMGYRVRTERSGDLSLISRAEEKMFFIQASLFAWNDEAVEYLHRWIEEGGNLFLALDDIWERYYSEDEKTPPLLKEFGITIKEEFEILSSNAECPDYDDNVVFEAISDDDALLLKDSAGNIRLIRIKRGKGSLTVTGIPFFLQSRFIGSAPNARLAWALFARPEYMAHNAKGGLFIRGTARTRGLLGSLFNQGNLTVLAVSFFVLVIVGFWTVIPRFGLVHAGNEKPGKALRERFLAEGRFLKRYGALSFYRGVYVREIKRRLSRKEGLSEDEKIFRRALEYWEEKEGRKESRLFPKIFGGEPFSYREFPKIICILKTILERI